MFCLSLNLTSNEWQRIQQAAGKQWPKEVLSRAEICRRYVLAGIQALGLASPADLERMAHEFQMSMEAGEERLRS
jgi:hypothetical protein